MSNAKTFIRSTLSSRALSGVLAILCFVVAGPTTAKGPEQVITERLNGVVPGLEVRSVRESAVPGLYEVETNNRDMIYATETGEYILAGEMLRLTGSGVENLTENSRAARRVETMADFGANGVISYPADGDEKAVISVFTDIDCPYCRKFHDDVPRMNELGITVHYYGFPRSGPATPSFTKYESVWCADNQLAAMDDAKAGKSVPAASCDNPVEDQFRLGSQVGVTGTPAIVLEDGNMVRGYVPADQLARGLGLL